MKTYRKVLSNNVLATCMADMMIKENPEQTARKLIVSASFVKAVMEHLYKFENFEDLKAEINTLKKEAEQEAEEIDGIGLVHVMIEYRKLEEDEQV